MGARVVGHLLSCICALAVAQAASAQSRPRHFDDIGRILCAEGAERYLPGDYYFCAANKALQAGKTGKALVMYEDSAAWGDKRAMFNLGLLYLRGDDMPRDEPLGLAWLALSAERPADQLHREVLAGAWTAASPETRSAADALWNRMKLKYADRVALVRAKQRYDRETALLRRELLLHLFDLLALLQQHRMLLIDHRALLGDESALRLDLAFGTHLRFFGARRWSGGPGCLRRARPPRGPSPAAR